MPIGIEANHTDAVAGFHAQGLESAGQARDAFAELQPGVTTFAVDGGDGVGDLLTIAL